MTESKMRDQPWRCLFCRMQTGVRLFGIPVCSICQDQVQDFLWVTALQGLLVATGLISGIQFVIEEVLLFTALVIVKHRLPGLFDRFIRRA